MEHLCRLLGKSRQAWYQGRKFHVDRSMQEEIILKEIERIREDLPRIGCYKLHYMLREFREKHEIKMGEKALRELLRSRNMLVKTKRRRKVRTTYSLGRGWNFYPNLIEDKVFNEPHLAWVADITYLPVGRSFDYLSLITDVYSHMIVGWALWESLEAAGPLHALNMALRQRKKKFQVLIHHSDRGIQYYSHRYTGLLKQNGIEISMTKNGDPYENAMAERVNGIIKDEILEGRGYPNHEMAMAAVEKAIHSYNQLRPHRSCDLLTPAKAHKTNGPLRKHWTKRSFKEPDSLAPTLQELEETMTNDPDFNLNDC
ncbi:MAG: IS3 family transposase [Bacteroidota bacterium]